MNLNISTVETRLTNLIENSKFTSLYTKYEEIKNDIKSVRNDIRHNETFVTNLKVLGTCVGCHCVGVTYIKSLITKRG